MNIRIVHVKEMSEVSFYIGRGNRKYKRSALANPFKLKSGEAKGGTLERYRMWLYERLCDGEMGIVEELIELLRVAKRGECELACYCAPAACHGEVVRSCLEWLGDCKTPREVKQKISKLNN